MADPKRYERGYSFAGFQANAPKTPLPGQKLDAELDGLGQSVNSTAAGLMDIRRSDGALQNGIVTTEALSPEVSAGVKPTVPWTTATQYNIGTTISYLSAFYRCVEQHISGVLADDIEAGLWVEFARLTPVFATTGQAQGGTNETASMNSKNVKEARVFAGFISTTDVQAVGDGTTNNTAAFTTAFARGGLLIIPPGTYMTDQIEVTAPTNIILMPGAVLKLRSITEADTGVLKFTAGAAGSSVSGGGTIDGNRAALLATYLAFTRQPVYGGTSYVIESEINGILAEPCDRLRVEGITIQNCITHGFVHRGGDFPVYRDIRVVDCAKVCNAQFFTGGEISNIHGQGVGNKLGTTTIPFWQPAYEFRDTIDVNYRDLVLADFAPHVRDGDGDVVGDPYPIGFAFERIDGGSITGLTSESYTFDAASSRTTSMSIGMVLSSPRGVQVSNLNLKGYYWPIQCESPQDCNFSTMVLDGAYNVTATNAVLAGADSCGIRVRGGGLYPFATSLPDNDYRKTTGGLGNTWANIIVKRCKVGITCFAAGHKFAGVSCVGNTTWGWLFAVNEINSSFASSPQEAPDDVTLDNCSGTFNGWSGVAPLVGDRVRINGGCWDNNGQLSTTSGLTAGITTVGGDSTGLSVVGGSASDTQSFTKTDCLSFAPGATDSSNQKTVLASAANGLAHGQHIKIVNGTGSGDVTAKIVEIDGEVLTVQTSGAVTFSDTGNLTSLAGTVAASGYTVTGTGTAFTTAIVGPVFIKVGSQYHRVAKVTSNTSLETVTPFSPSVSAGTSASLVQCDLQGIPSQATGLYVDSGALDVSWTDLRMSGNTQQHTLIEDINSLADGQEFLLQGPVVNASTSGVDTLLLGPYTAAMGLIPLAYSFKVVSTITGADGLVSFIFGTNTGSTTVVNGLSRTAGTIASGPVYGVAPTVDFFYPTARIYGGADNTPSGGSYQVNVLFRKQTTVALT